LAVVVAAALLAVAPGRATPAGASARAAASSWFRQRIFWARYDDEKGAPARSYPGTASGLAVMVRLWGCEPAMPP
jgi:hypothetical protein